MKNGKSALFRVKSRISICGQGPSDKIHFAKWLIDAGIDSLGLIPESVIRTILELEKLS